MMSKDEPERLQSDFQRDQAAPGISDQLREAGYHHSEAPAVLKSIAQADAGTYVSQDERDGRKKMMLELGRFISREEYLADKAGLDAHPIHPGAQLLSCFLDEFDAHPDVAPNLDAARAEWLIEKTARIE